MAEAIPCDIDIPRPGWATIHVNGKVLSLHYIKIKQPPGPDYYYKICERKEADATHSFIGIDHTFSYKRIPSQTLVSGFRWEFYCKIPFSLPNKFLYLLSHYEVPEGRCPFIRNITDELD
jgi:hypothetical protein